MHTNTLKSLALALTFWLALHAAALKAQIVGPLGTSPYNFEVDSNGLLSVTGNYGTGSLSLSGAGTEMFWYPGKGAFRAGRIDTEDESDATQWNDGNIGNYSVAFGLNCMASGPYSISMGFGSTASAYGAVALGEWPSATQEGAAALGWGTASGFVSFAANSGAATGGYSAAFGSLTTASGYYSVASGFLTTASGDGSTASGWYTQAKSYLSFAIGRYNLGLAENGATPSTTAWHATENQADPLFEIGNGSYGNPTPTLSDAFVVYKDGNAVLQGCLKVAPTGDIPMYSPH